MEAIALKTPGQKCYGSTAATEQHPLRPRRILLLTQN
jgi:hypothetical protein